MTNIKLTSSENVNEFLNELATLTHKYKVGITGEPVLFVLERDDFALGYTCDDDSKLVLT